MSVRRAQDERLEGSPDGLNAIVEISDVPDTPGTPSATNVGTSRAYNNGAATVTVTSAATGGTPTSYTVTSSPGSFTGSGTSPVTVTGLASATSYSFTATATNSTGTSPATAASNSITATTVPQAPTIGTATAGSAGSGQATVAFTAGATGGSAITGYTATSSPGSITGTGSSSPITVSGLTNGTAYTFTVTATNANGTSTASSASNSITVAVPTFIYWTRGTNNISTSLDKFSVNTETRSTGPTTVSSRGNAGAGLSNSPTAGYFATGTPDGSSANTMSSVEKFTFSSETSATVISSGAFQRIGNPASMSNTGTAGYYAGGEYFSQFSNTGKITYSNDTFSNISKNLASNAYNIAGLGNKGSAGYVCWGNGLSRIDKFTFSNETYSLIGNMGQATYGPSAMANTGTAGYGTGGTGGSSAQNMRKITFSNDTVSAGATSLSVPRYHHNSNGVKGVAGYTTGGGTGSPGDGASTIEKLDFSTETRTVTSAVTGSTGPAQFQMSIANEGSI